jgi:CheY-like chemotaxis protein
MCSDGLWNNLPGVPTARLLVAVVDDEPAVCKALGRLLRSSGIDVMTFAVGASFIASLARRKPDCVLLDINMLGMNGFDVESQLASDPATRGIAIVFITGNYSPEVEQRARASRPDVHLMRKPLEQQGLLDEIRSAVASKHG